MIIDKNMAAAYSEEGFLNGVDIFDTKEITHFRRCFDKLEAVEGREACQIGLQARHLTDEFIWQLATNNKLLEVMEHVIGENLLLLSTHFFCKYPDPSGEKFVAWHQDVTYWGLEPPEAHTAWIAIDDADTQNGCMRAIPKSHNEGIVTHKKSAREGNLLSINQSIPDEEVDSSQAVDMPLLAGQISIHDGKLFHASNPNTSDRRRCGLTVRFVEPHVKQIEVNSVGDKWPAILVRGKDNYNHFANQEAPFTLPH